MTIPVLIILGALWAAVLVPPLLRARSERKTGAIGDYAHTLGALKTSNRTLTSAPRLSAGLVDGSRHSPRMSKEAEIRKRRKDVLTVLLASTGITFLLAVLVSSTALWFINFICLVALVGYVYMLIQIKNQKQMRKERTQRFPNDQI